MITDPVLIQRVHRVLSTKPRKYVTSPDVLAVMQKETSGQATFKLDDLLFKENLNAAIAQTHLTREALLQLLTINYGPLKGQVSKFRLEPGYWIWAQNLKGSWTVQERALLSCSFGVGQKMARWLVQGVPGAQWVQFTEQFMGNIDLQIQYLAGDLDQLLQGAGGVRPVAYTRYNEGTRDDPRTGKPRLYVSDYGKIAYGYYKSFVGAGH